MFLHLDLATLMLQTREIRYGEGTSYARLVPQLFVEPGRKETLKLYGYEEMCLLWAYQQQRERKNFEKKRELRRVWSSFASSRFAVCFFRA